MEKIIEISSFDSMKLKELREFLENNQINGIDINFKDEITIKYYRELVNVNKKFNYKVKLIRNKYYRQLLNIINIINPKRVYCVSFDEWGNRIYLENHIDVNNYKNMLKMALINYIGVYNFDNIFELSKDEMLELKEYKHMNDITEYLIRLMGAYIPEKAKEKVVKALGPKIYGSKLDEMKKCRNFIIICPEIIQEFCVEYFKDFNKCEVNDIFEFYTIMFNLVLIHEVGHAVFENTFDLYDGNDERRANYFASLTFDGTFDKIIKKKTDIQKGEYENPILITDDDDMTEIKKNVYNI